jgi:type IV secretion system protein VirD4
MEQLLLKAGRYMPWLRSSGRGPFGQAQWAGRAGTDSGVAGAARGPFIGLWGSGSGRRPKFEPMHYTKDGHLLMVAPSRSGKARDILVRSLLTNVDSAIIIDVKGELAAITARARREMGHEVYCLNPFGLHKDAPWSLPQHGFNPLAVIDPESENFIADIESLAGALIQHDGNEAAHWADGARSLLGGLMIHEILTARAKGVLPSLAEVREHLTMSDEDFETTIDGIVKRHGSKIVHDRLAMFVKLTNELRAFKSTAKTQTTWLSDAAMERVTDRHDFAFADMKRKPMTVYVALPSRLISAGMTYNRYLRLIVQAAIDAMTTTPRTSNRPVWFLIDEFASLGAMPIFERMLSEGAGYGLQLQPIVQNLGQLKELYRGNWETFVANAALQQWFAPRDFTTADYVSKMLGQFTANPQTINADGKVSIGETGRALLRPEEVMQLTEAEQIVFLKGCPNPFRSIFRSPYFDRRWGLQGKYDPNPYFVE